MTDDAWFGVTAEPIAEYVYPSLYSLNHSLIPTKSIHLPSPKTQICQLQFQAHTNNKPSEIAAELNRKGLSRPHGAPRVIVDLFAGAGGNTIAFARAGHWDQVIGIELDAPTLACAQHNAAVYGVADRITWIHGDCMDFLNRLKSCPWTLDAALQLCQAQRAGLVEAGTTPGTGTGTGTALAPLAENVELFASPPWGGPAYSGAEVLDLDAMEPFGVERLHRAMSPMAHALFLPRNGDLRQLANLVPNDAREKLDVVQYCINGGSKGLVVYYPIDEAYQDS